MTIAALNSGAKLIGYIIGHVSIDWQLTGSFIFIAALGSSIGTYLSEFMSADRLEKWFGYCVIKFRN
jgi:uncharacterized protein